MPYELRRSGIITGTLNCFCLACNSFLQSWKEAVCHIETSSHCESLSTVPYLEKFKEQGIRKFNAGYFCEFCNKLMASSVQVNLHEAEDNHRHNKLIYFKKSINNGVIRINNIVIEERAWHGLKDNVCYICEIEFENGDLHKLDSSHALRLVQRPVTLEGKDAIYRQINLSTVQCLTCNILLDSSSKSKHLDEHSHLFKKDKIEENKEIKDDRFKDKNVAKTTNSLKDTDGKDSKTQNSSCIKERNPSLIVQRTTTFQSSNIDINYETEVAFCRKCRVCIKFVYSDIINHIEEHSNIETSTSPVGQYPPNVNSTKYCTKPHENVMDVENMNNDQVVTNIENEHPKVLLQLEYTEDTNEDQVMENNKDHFTSNNNSANQEINNERNSLEVHKFAKENDITYNLYGGKATCRTCEVDLPFSLKSMKEHVKGLPHNRNLRAKRVKVSNSRKKQTVEKYVRSINRLESSLLTGYIINRSVFISKLSYLLYQLQKGCIYAKCLLCGDKVSPFTFKTHVKTCSLPAGKKLQVIITDRSEFIREIRPETFHCGHCNLIISGWSDMESHLQSTDHDRKKSNSFLCLGVSCGRLPFSALLLLDDE